MLQAWPHEPVRYWSQPAAIYISGERYQVRPVTAFAPAGRAEHPDCPADGGIRAAELAVHEYSLYG